MVFHVLRFPDETRHAKEQSHGVNLYFIVTYFDTVSGSANGDDSVFPFQLDVCIIFPSDAIRCYSLLSLLIQKHDLDLRTLEQQTR